MKQHFTLIIFILIICFPPLLFGQGELGFHLQYNRQLDGLQSAGLRDGWGFSTELLSSPLKNEGKPWQVQLGGRFDVSFTGTASTGLVFEDSWGDIYDIQVSNTNAGGYGLLRVSSLPTRHFQLYMDGLVGARFFYSSEGIDHDEDDECPEYETTFLTTKLTPSWGGSLGMLVFFSPEFALDLKASYLQGLGVSFVDLESIQPNDGNTFDYNIRTARSSQLMFQVGLNILLIGGCDEGYTDDCGSSFNFGSYSSSCH